jgi:hypothetical protein
MATSNFEMHLNRADTRVHPLVQDVAINATDHSNKKMLPMSSEMRSTADVNNYQRTTPTLLPGVHSNCLSNGQFVTISDLFSLLHTAEIEGRLSPEKGTRLRHVLIDAESSARANGGCWMNVAFRIMCELIPPPVYPAASGAAVISADVIKSEEKRYKPSLSMHQEGMLALPVQAPQDLEFSSTNKEGILNDDAVAALLDMKMNPTPTNDKKRKAVLEHPSEPSNKTQAKAMYPYPFSSAKDPKLFRRTRCKAPNCPNNGGACPDHGHDIKICKVGGCTNRAVKSGVCSKHGAQRPLCRVNGCTNQAKREGKCIKHGAVYGNCSEEGCVNQARSGGLCRKHGAK